MPIHPPRSARGVAASARDTGARWPTALAILPSKPAILRDLPAARRPPVWPPQASMARAAGLIARDHRAGATIGKTLVEQVAHDRRDRAPSCRP